MNAVGISSPPDGNGRSLARGKGDAGGNDDLSSSTPWVLRRIVHRLLRLSVPPRRSLTLLASDRMMTIALQPVLLVRRRLRHRRWRWHDGADSGVGIVDLTVIVGMMIAGWGWMT